MQSIALMARIKKPSKTKFPEKISKCNMQIIRILIKYIFALLEFDTFQF